MLAIVADAFRYAASRVGCVDGVTTGETEDGNLKELLVP
jgi:hypothetical protein